MKRRAIVIWAAVSLSLGIVPSAQTHSSLADSNPKARSVIAKLPKLLWIEFDGNLITLGDKKINFLSVTNRKGRELSDGEPFIGGARLSVKIKHRKAAGPIKVSWRVVSQDGHPVSSYLTFMVRR